MKNYEKIKNMSINELAFLLARGRCDKCANSNCYENQGTCLNGIKQWLNSEASV